jgi:hypothetical protein
MHRVAMGDCCLWGNYLMAVGMNGRMFYCYEYGENIEHFE